MVAYNFKRQFVAPIQLGLGQLGIIPNIAPKLQTIRAIGKRRHARPGESIQLYCGQRTKHCFSIGVARCIDVRDIRIWVDRGAILIDDCAINEEDGGRPLDSFAQADGFDDWKAMQAFWREEHPGPRLGPFTGIIIRWEPIT